MLQRCFDAEAAETALTGGVATPPLETLDALRAGMGVGGASRTGSVTQADFERYHEVRVGARCILHRSVLFVEQGNRSRRKLGREMGPYWKVTYTANVGALLVV